MLYYCVLVMHNNGFYLMLSYVSIKNFDQIPSISLSVSSAPLLFPNTAISTFKPQYISIYIYIIYKNIK